jgi:hypothetical protein
LGLSAAYPRGAESIGFAQGPAGKRTEMPKETPEEREQAELAAKEAAAIRGGDLLADPLDADPDRGVDPALVPVNEAGGGEAEGFEQSEELLVEHASHGDEQSAHAVLHDQGSGEEEIAAGAYGEADSERSSERADEETPSEQ